ncbi:hypothetical protein LWI29_009079 [Acer saccharum]|uniref:Retrotransposon gag domain-containing protein n=1 Tax=Acer saccharum TaxID=4024 RepID=A0AA39SMW1_ACESA|nr:hypothetical protein LWI29_009079 [Acer saccharum]
MAGSGSAPTVEEQIAMLNAQMAASAERLQALEAENAAIRAANEELRTLVDGVVPDSATSEHPIPTSNDEHGVDRPIPRVPDNPNAPEVNPVDHQNRPTLQTARVEIDLNDVPARNDAANEYQLPVDQQPANIPKAVMSLQSTPGLVKPGPDLNLSANLDFSRRFTEMEALIQRIPGVPAPIKKSTANSFADSPFVDAIALMEMPKKFNFPNMKQYEGTTDPDDHIAQYKQRMFTAAIPCDLREACMCKAFGSSLSGPALQWYTNLPNNSIDSFAQLTDTFVEQFASSRKLEKLSDDLYTITQRTGKNLRAYVGRFNREKVQIPHCNQATAIYAFRKGLRFDSDLYKELTKYPCRTMEDVLAKAWAQIKWEEDEANFVGKANGSYYGSRRNERVDKKSNDGRSEPYPTSDRRGIQSRHENSRERNTYGRGIPRSSRPKVEAPEYLLSIEPVDLVAVMREMGKSVKWPRKMNALPEHRDSKIRCEFHGDHGHRTEDCIALKFEVAELLKRGHLREFLTDKGKQTYARRDDQRQTGSVDSPPEPPRQDRVINCISGGSEVSGVSYSAAKRKTRQVSNAEIQPNREHPSKVDETVTFRSTDKSDLFSPHHDALVISLHIANCLTKRILIDNGSSCNILFNSALREMQVDESKLSRRTTMLTGFSGEQKSTLGEIVLPVYAEGVNLYINFLVLDCQSPYNAILGRPWIHELKAIPSTYHQLIKFPTKWGVKEIKGEQRAARECYQNALKKKKQEL